MCLFFCLPFANIHSISVSWKFWGQSNCSSAYMQRYCAPRCFVLLKKITNKSINKEQKLKNKKNKQIPNKIHLKMSACGSVFCDVWMFIKPMVILHNDILFVLTIFWISVALTLTDRKHRKVKLSGKEGKAYYHFDFLISP